MKRAGFSLAEIVVTSLIVAVAMFQIIDLLNMESRSAELSAYYVAAQSAAISLAERAVQDLTENGFTPIDRAETASGTGLAPRNYSYQVTARPGEADSDLWRITATVSWQSGSETRSHQLSVERLLSRADLAFTGRYPYRRGFGRP